MLPPKLETGHEFDISAGASETVLVKIDGGNNVWLGRFLHTIKEWQVVGFEIGSPHVTEWHFMPNDAWERTSIGERLASQDDD